MAVIPHNDQTGLTLKATIRNATLEFWRQDTEVFEAYNSARWATTGYLVSVTEPGKPGAYQFTVPANLPGTTSAPVLYRYDLWMLPSGSASAANDTPWTAPGYFGWDGTNVLEMTERVTLTDTTTDVTNGVGLADGAITAAKIATGAIDADALATDAVNEIAAAVTTSVDPRGTGADEVTIDITREGSAAVADADVWITSDSGGDNVVAGTLQTNSQGEVTFLLDAGVTYYLWAQKDGVNSIRGESFVAVAD